MGREQLVVVKNKGHFVKKDLHFLVL